MILWQPVLAGIATYGEVCDKWDLSDLLDAVALVQYRQRVEQEQAEKIRESR